MLDLLRRGLFLLILAGAKRMLSSLRLAGVFPRLFAGMILRMMLVAVVFEGGVVVERE